MTEKTDTHQKNSILLADDNEDNLLLLSEILEQDGYEVRQANSGGELLAKANELAPDLFLLDINMTDMDGYDVCKKLKRSDVLAPIPVIFISGQKETFNKIKGFELGAVDYIVKPFDLDEVRVRVKTHLAHSEKMAEIAAFNDAMVDREMRIVELKEEVNRLAQELGQPIPYPTVWKDAS